MKNIFKAVAVMLTMCLTMAVCGPVSAQADSTQKNTDENSINIDIFAKDKNINSGDETYFVSVLTDEAGNPVADKTVYFYQNIMVSGLGVDHYIGETDTDDYGTAVLKVELSIAGDSESMFVGCVAEDTETGRAIYSDHVMITVTNPYPVLSDDENQEELLNY
ncbi:hypothetical protein [Methanoplanus endosymbiosus]|uniref:Uncharacterized protein n=1 Tax=Methanoplanus endosymbiosus TaxID=33865 RepID=A0A9E7PLN9_9EURY|nr:hypothetical protein [Methanoplanus endosymbiosus]UUX91121.1 hypothetical protein L6E24_06930 [Methanoplanus endosymbiosus]